MRFIHVVLQIVALEVPLIYATDMYIVLLGTCTCTLTYNSYIIIYKLLQPCCNLSTRL